MMTMTDMKLPKKKREKLAETATAQAGEGPEYPYGLSIRLEKDSLEKLGLSVDDFEIDKPGMLKAEFKVTSLESRQNGESSDESVGLQITKLSIMEDKPPARMTRKELEEVE